MSRVIVIGGDELNPVGSSIPEEITDDPGRAEE